MPNHHLLPAVLLLMIVPLACTRESTIDTRTFALQYIEAGTALGLLDPYVFGDRPNNPGTISATQSTVTVRETPDNLEKIARVLEEYDVPSPWVRLSFQIIEADGAAAVDPDIAEVEAELRRLFRYDGYRLVGQAVVSATSRSRVEQAIRSRADPEKTFFIEVEVGEIRQIGDTGFVNMHVELRAGVMGGLATQINARTGQTVVLGNAQLGGGDGTTILTVTAELVEN